MKKNGFIFLSTLLLLCLFSCRPKLLVNDVAGLSWQQIEQQAKGTTIVMNMYQGDKRANRYMSEYVVPALRKRYGILLKIVGGQGKEIVNNIMSEKEVGKEKGQIDLCWINGETFYQLREIDGLFGPYTERLPNSRYINYEDPIIKYDFQQDIAGYETPWGKAFFYVIGDTAKIKELPVSMQAFEQYWKANPGKFTLSLDFLGMTLLKSWLVELAGGITELDGAFNHVKYEKYAGRLWDFINRNKKYFWKNGETFPAGNTSISQMYSNGELNFTFAFGLAEIDRKVEEGLFPASSKGFILKAGCVQNTSYLGIPFNSANKAAAMVACNFLISPEAQIHKADVKKWGSAPVFERSRLEKKWQDSYDSLPRLKYALPETEVAVRAIKETASPYMIKIFEDFRRKVIEAKP